MYSSILQRIYKCPLINFKGFNLTSTVIAGRGINCNLVNFSNKLNQDTVVNQLPNEADFVVIGAGSVGCSTAYHLARLNKGNVLLLERDKITSGTTWHSAGILWSFKSPESESQLLLQTRELISEILPEVNGENAGWLNTGTIHIMKNQLAYQNFLPEMSTARFLGNEIVDISPNEINELHPLINVSDVHAAVYSPGDGTIDPATYCMALVKAATTFGAKVFERCAVTNINTKQDDLGYNKVVAVDTTLGQVKTNVVINCTGAWAPNLGKMIGVRIPQLAYKHAYVVTEPIKGIEKTPMIKDHGTVYIKPQGNALNFGGYELNPHLIDDLPNDFSFGLYDLDWNVFNPHFVAAANRVPAIENVGIKSTVCGPESFTPDSSPNMGESPEVRGFFVGSAFNSGGMMLGGGAGRQLAHWAYHGKPEFDLHSCDIKRHAKKLSNYNKWLHERCHNTFAERFKVIFRHVPRFSGRNQRFGPLHDVHKANGALFDSKHGFERPDYYVTDDSGKPRDDLDVLPYDYYGNYGHKQHQPYPYNDEVLNDSTFEFAPKSHRLIGNECLACRTSCAIFDSSPMTKYHITGDDAEQLMRNVFTRDVCRSKNNQFIYTLMLNKDAGIEGDAVVTKIKTQGGEPLYYVTMSSSGEQYFMSHIEKVASDHRLKCKIENKTDDVAILSVQGPKSADLLSCVVDNISLNDFRYGEWREAKISDVSVMIARLSFVGELGFEVHCKSEDAVAVYDVIIKHRDKYQARLAGYKAMESLSSEAGFHHWPQSINSSDNPVESGLLRFCDDTDVYVGSDVLRRLREETIHKRFFYFTVKCDVPLFGGEVILKNDHVVGYLRMATFAHSLDCNIGCGYVASTPDLDQEELGCGEYMIEGMGVEYPAEVHEKAPFDRR